MLISLSTFNQLLSGAKRIENSMNAKQKYLFDLTGYLHLKDVLATDELSKAKKTIDRLLEAYAPKCKLRRSEASSFFKGFEWRVAHPPGGSTLMTSAPSSPNIQGPMSPR